MGLRKGRVQGEPFLEVFAMEFRVHLRLCREAAVGLAFCAESRLLGHSHTHQRLGGTLRPGTAAGSGTQRAASQGEGAPGTRTQGLSFCKWCLTGLRSLVPRGGRWGPTVLLSCGRLLSRAWSRGPRPCGPTPPATPGALAGGGGLRGAWVSLWQRKGDSGHLEPRGCPPGTHGSPLGLCPAAPCSGEPQALIGMGGPLHKGGGLRGEGGSRAGPAPHGLFCLHSAAARQHLRGRVPLPGL